ncbi:hypothetical protein MRI28_11765 [Nocardiopsis dassonvillei]|uniref:hypothetical protein n=1 Tax=Nocardiopsis dassonvillei TaxID=2014 RepID=UPI00200D19EE|nr:hypothetical protein [Nocardiopsis dassonvillei]MCK9870308.1 hypothetical protein [Nocardiopsis dassonvillei]
MLLTPTAPAAPALWSRDRAALVHSRTRALALACSLGTMPVSVALGQMQAPDRVVRAHTRRPAPAWTGGEPLVDLPGLVRALHARGEWTHAFAALSAALAHPVRPQDLAADLASVRARSDVAGLLLTLDADRPLRDVVVVARRVVYELGHDRAGHLDRVRRIEDPVLAALVADQVLDLAVWADHAPAVAAAHRARAGRP